MTSTTTAQTLSLWSENRPDSHQFGEGPTETAVREAIEAIHELNALEGQQIALAQICRSLARNIDAGNTKGRAIANEAQQLATMLDTLQGITGAETADEGIPADVRQLFELGAVPVRNDAAEIRDSA